MVPDVETPTSSSSSTLNLEQIDRSESTRSMPVYHGTIIHVEPHNNNRNTSDLIIRIPNFQCSPSSASDTDTKPQQIIKRRAPICPVLSNPNTANNRENIRHVDLKQTKIVQSNRLTTGLRSLGRAFTHNCRSKRTASITEVIFPRSLPDVEVLNEKCETLSSSKKTAKDDTFSSTIPKMTPPKISFVKQKDLPTKRRQVSSSSSSSLSSTDMRRDLKHQRLDQISTSTILTTQYTEVTKSNSPRVTSFLQGLDEDDHSAEAVHICEEDDHHEIETTSLTYEVEQQIKAICQLVSDQPVSSVEADSLSIHRYSSISTIIPENRTEEISSPDKPFAVMLPTSMEISENINRKWSSRPYRPFHIETSILQPDISVVRIGTNNLTTEIGRILPGEMSFHGRQQIESILEEDSANEIQFNDEVFAECYEVTYQLDESKRITNQSITPAQIILNPLEYRQLVTGLPETSSKQHEQIERGNTISETVSTDRLSDIREQSPENPTNEEIFTYNTKSENFPQVNPDPVLVDQPEPTSETSSSSSDHSVRHCSLNRSNSYDGYGVYVSTDIETHHEHLIQQVEEFSPGDKAGLKENDRILCINGASVIDEDYTVVLQLIKHGSDTDTLDFDVMANDAYEEFKSQMNSIS
ncbi:unnamed protein product [Adineta ricciae]|uniref:PDZ domain-containing protein n=1 Tax=Adineta ricciae TaxID=249248 RepID=A0A815DWJ5_ADIRI|nr:unnamed protein product [Adineta ricciae]